VALGSKSAVGFIYPPRLGDGLTSSGLASHHKRLTTGGLEA
jgi:hypothetical protein